MFTIGEAPFDRDVLVLRALRAALSDRVPGLEKISDQRLAQALQSAPVSAKKLLGRKRLRAKRSLIIDGIPRQIDLDGKYNVWAIRNGELWATASEGAIDRHLETGAPPLTTVTPPTPKGEADNPENGCTREPTAPEAPSQCGHEARENGSCDHPAEQR